MMYPAPTWTDITTHHRDIPPETRRHDQPRSTRSAGGATVVSTVATATPLQEMSRQAGHHPPGSSSQARAGGCDTAAFERLARVLGLRVRGCMAPSAPARGGPTKPTRGRRQRRCEYSQKSNNNTGVWTNASLDIEA